MLLSDVVNGHIFGVVHQLGQILGWGQIVSWNISHELECLLLESGAVLKLQILDELGPLFFCVITTVEVLVNFGVKFDLEDGFHPSKLVLGLDDPHSAVGSLDTADPHQNIFAVEGWQIWLLLRRRGNCRRARLC